MHKELKELEDKLLLMNYSDIQQLLIHYRNELQRKLSEQIGKDPIKDRSVYKTAEKIAAIYRCLDNK